MYEPDFEAFRSVLNRCAEVFSKPQPSDVIVQAYWRALKDVDLATVQRRADEHCKRGKFFPKPYELRPREEKAPRHEDPAFRAAEASNVAHWEEMRREDPERHRREVAKARIARLEVVGDRSSSTYAEEMRQLRRIAYG